MIADTAPERQSGRKAQISNITAAKVGLLTTLPDSMADESIDGSRRDTDVSGPEIDAENDS